MAGIEILRISLFGEAHFEWAGRAHPFHAPPRTLPLLAYLALHRDRSFHRSMLAGIFWPDASESEARANLRRHIHYLQNALPPAPEASPWLLITTQSIQWNPAAPTWVDVAAFEQFMQEEESIQSAVDLYQGELLRGLDEEWIYYERERLQNLYIQGLRQIVLQGQRNRLPDQSIAAAERILKVDPYCESVLLQLMKLYYEQGDRAGALQAYERFAGLLEQELQIRPMPETVALYQAVLQNAPATLPEKLAPAFFTQTPSEETPWVGRVEELEVLAYAWKRAAHGSGNLVLIGGEAGIGKTRLIQQFQKTVEQQGPVLLLHGAVLPTEAAPYQAITAALTPALTTALAQCSPQGLPADWKIPLARLLPTQGGAIFQPDDPTRPGAASQGQAERDHLFQAFVDCLRWLSQNQPVCFILEDVHWASASTFDLLEWLARNLARLPVLLLLSYREEEIPPTHPLRSFRRRLQSEKFYYHLALNRLSPNQVFSWCRMLPAFKAISKEQLAQFADQLHQSSEGNPLFVELFLNYWKKQRIGSTPPDSTGGLPPAEQLVDTPDLQQRMDQLLAPRLNQLSPEAVTLIEMGSVAGQTFNLEELCAVSGWEEAQVLDRLGDLLDSRLVHEAASKQSNCFAFHHQLIQAAIYRNTTPARKKRFHRRMGQVLESFYPQEKNQRAATLARHFELGGDPQTAAQYQILAARYALSLFDDETALLAIQKALGLLTQIHPTSLPLKFDLIALRESIHHRRGDRADQQADLAELNHLAELLEEENKYCDVQQRQIQYFNAIGDREAEWNAIEKLADMAQRFDLPFWRARALYAQGNYQLLTSQLPCAAQSLEKALEGFRQIQDAESTVETLCLLAEIAVTRRDKNQAQGYVQEALTLTGAESARPVILKTIWSAAAACLAEKDLPACFETSQSLLAEAEKARDDNWSAAAYRLMAQVCLRQFRTQEARAYLQEALQRYNRIGKLRGQALVQESFGFLALSLGQYAEAITAYQRAMQLHQPLQDTHGQIVCLVNLGCAAGLASDRAQQKAYAVQAIQLCQQFDQAYLEAVALNCLGEAEIYLGQIPDAIQHLRRSMDFHQQNQQQADYASSLALFILAHLILRELDGISEWTAALQSQLDATVDQVDDPQALLWICAQAYHAVQNEAQASATLKRAYRLFTQKAATIPDEAMKETYRALPFNREITAAVREQVWPLDQRNPS